MSEVEVRAAVGAEVQRELKLVDCDVHAQPTPAMLTRYLSPRWARHLERYGRRAPMVTEWYPRARNGGMAHRCLADTLLGVLDGDGREAVLRENALAFYALR